MTENITYLHTRVVKTKNMESPLFEAISEKLRICLNSKTFYIVIYLNDFRCKFLVFREK